MKSDCGTGGGGGSYYYDGTERHFDLDCGTDCENCGKHYYGGCFYVCPDCEKKTLTNACKKKIRDYESKHGKPMKEYRVSKNAKTASEERSRE